MSALPCVFLLHCCEGCTRAEALVEFQKSAAGNMGQMQSSLHQERLRRQEQAALCTKLDVDKQQKQHRCHDLEAKLRVQKHMMTRVYTQICCTGSVLMHTSYIQVAEVRATEAEEEQYRTEQELASARYGLHASHLHNQAMEVNMCFLKLGFLLACPAAQHLQATCNSTHTLSRAWSARPAYCVIARMLPHSGCLVDTVSGKPMSDLACVFHPH